jgi:hypothetical protein
MRIGANTKLGLITTVKLGFKVPSLSLVSVRMETLPNSNQSKANPMTKSDEIQILTAAADSLGSDSYCGDWLREQIPFIESDIRSDIEPGILASASIQDCTRRCAEMRADSLRERDKIILDARNESERIMDAALKLADSIRSGLRRDIESALHQITKF